MLITVLLFLSRPKHVSDGINLPALIMFSSGTTGPPKAIPLSHASLVYQFQDLHLPQCGPILCFSSLFWFSGIVNLLMATLSNIPRVVVRQQFNAKLCLDVIKKHQVQLMICPPSQPMLMLHEKADLTEDLKSLKMILCGGSAVPDSLVKRFPVLIAGGYGLTEACGGVTSAGQLANGVVVKIIDEEGNKLGVEERGEICIKPRFPFLGYYGNPEATKDMLKGGFLHTGDIGLFNSSGQLQVVDRKKEIFKYSNFQVNPTDIEQELGGLSGISMVSVVGILHEIYGALPAACIIRAKEGKKITEEDVHRFAKENSSPHKWLRGGVYFMKELPMTISGKVQRKQLTEIVAELFKENPDIGFLY